MTIDTFFRKLRKVDRKWRIQRDGCIRSGRTCPVCAVAGVVGVSHYEAALKIGLDVDDSNEIAVAADGYGSVALRRRLLRACGLQEIR